jgi:hypothetical protein
MIHGELARNRAGLLGMLVTFLLLILMAPVQSYGQTVRSADLLQQLNDSLTLTGMSSQMPMSSQGHKEYE